MELIVIGSNSSGNAYLLKSSTGTLLIECGVHIKRIKEALKFNLRNVVAIVSHSHGDHAQSMKDVMNAGINVYTGQPTLEAKGLINHHRANVINAGKIFSVNGFKIKPFEVNHDVPCFGFLIQHEEMGLCVFLTDSFYSDYVFEGVNQFIVECNHDIDIMFENNTKKFLRDRVVNSHMNLDTCKDMLLANDLSKVNNIVLIHLSNTNSNPIMFKKQIEQATGKVVQIAVPGLVIDNFNLQPF